MNDANLDTMTIEELAKEVSTYGACAPNMTRLAMAYLKLLKEQTMLIENVSELLTLLNKGDGK